MGTFLNHSGSFSDNSEVVFWDHLGTFRDHFGLILGSLFGTFSDHFEAMSGTFGTILVPVCESSEIS